MSTFNQSNESSNEYEEHANVALITSKSFDVQLNDTTNNDDDDDDRAFSNLSCDEVEVTLRELLGNIQRMIVKYRDLEKYPWHVIRTPWNFGIRDWCLENENDSLKTQTTQSPITSECNPKKYEEAFKWFQANRKNKSKTTSLIYGVSMNSKKILGYVNVLWLNLMKLKLCVLNI